MNCSAKNLVVINKLIVLKNNKMFVRKLLAWDFEVQGKVRGVFFRKNTEAQAKRQGLHERIMNTLQGTVKGQLQGTRHTISAMNDCLQKKDSPMSSIEKTMHHSLRHKTSSSSNMAKLIDGKAIAAQIRAELNKEVQNLTTQGAPTPHITAILVGEDAASQTYVRMKMQAARDVGISSETKRVPSTITEKELLDLIDTLNCDEKVHGILVQLPVPEHLNERRICNAVALEKDVDGFNEVNMGRMCLDMNSMIPATPLGVIELLRRTGIDAYGKNAVVVGRSKNVGWPIAMLLHADGRQNTKAMDATVTICHRFTPREELIRFCRTADIIVTATGIPCLITKSMIKPGACVIDVGVTRIKDPVTGKTKLVGDVDFDEVRQVAGHITPVPGGVGPMTVAMLMLNVVTAAKNFSKKTSANGNN